MALAINDDGVYDPELFTVSCLDALNFGTAYASLHDDIVIGTDKNCNAVLSALSAGILSMGKNIWSCCTCTQMQLKYAISTLKLGAGIFIEASCGNIKLIPLSRHGFSLNSNEEKAVTDSLASLNILPSYKEGKTVNSSTLNEMYHAELRHICPPFPPDTDIQINSSNAIIKNFLRSIIPEQSHEFSKGITFQISSDGMRASAYSCDTGFVFYEKLLLICCLYEFRKGNDIPLAHDFPIIADKLARSCGQTVFRYDPLSAAVCDISKRSIALEFSFLNDGAAMIFKIIKIMHDRSLSLSELLDEIPSFTTTVKYVNLKNDPEGTIKKLRDTSENNICYEQDDGRIIARASRSGKSLILYAESYRTESADELCSSWMLGTGIR